MKMSQRVAWAFVSILAVAIAAPNLLPAGEGAADGWTALVNGTDLQGWKFHFGKQGAGYGCWCTHVRLRPAVRRENDRQRNKDFIRSRIEAGPPPGLW